MSEHQHIGDCCVVGSIHTGTPTGTVSTIYGLSTYIAPSPDGSKAKTVVFIPDVFGYDLPNVRLLADTWAKSGFYVLVPDFFDGDAVPHEHLNGIVPNLRVQAEKSAVERAAAGVKATASYGPWAVRHRDAVVKPIIEGFFNAVKTDPEIKKLGAVGFCFGGRFATLVTHPGEFVVDAAVAFHPAGLAVPAELEPISRPLLIVIGDRDDFLPVAQIAEVQKVFEELKAKGHATPLEVKVYAQAVHGFAVRGDDETPEEKKLKEDAANDGVNFLKKWLA